MTINININIILLFSFYFFKHTVTYQLLPHPINVFYKSINLLVLTSPETPFYDIQTSDPVFAQALKTIKAADFIAWDPAFFDFIGTEARLERILGFPEGEGHVHEAPVYVPETNELLFSDTSAVGWLWGIDVDTYKVSSFVLLLPVFLFFSKRG